MGGYYRPSASRRSHDRIIDIILRSGENNAQDSLRLGDILAGTVQDLGGRAQQHLEVTAQKREEKRKAAEMGKRDAAWVSYVESGDWQKDPKSAYAMAQRMFGPEGDKKFAALQSFQALMGEKRDPEADKKHLGTVIRGLKGQGDAVWQRWWPTLRGAAERVYPGQVPAQFDPSMRGEYEGIGAALLGEKAEAPKTREIKRRLPDGSEEISIVEDKPGFTTTSAPEAPKPDTRSLEAQAADALAKGDTATYNRLLRVRSDVSRADDKPTGISGPSAETTSLVDAVDQNPSLWESLTPTVRGQIAAELNKRGFDFGKPLPEAAVLSIATSKSAVDQLKALKADIQANEQYVGPLAGVQALNPYSEGRKVQAKLDLARQRVGKALEGGVLRKEDEEKYKKILATLYDDPALAYSKLDGLIAALERDVENYINEQRRAGRRVNTSGTSRGSDGLGRFERAGGGKSGGKPSGGSRYERVD